MTVALLVPLAVSVVLWLVAAPVGRRLPPTTAVRALTVCLLATAAATGFVLAAWALLAVGQVPAVAAVGEWSSTALGAEDTGIPALGGWLAVPVVVALGTAAVRRALGTLRQLAAAARTCRSLGPGVDGLVVVEDSAPEAYALPGRPGRTIVSTAMLRALPADERRVLLAHEAAHLSRRHHLYVAIAELAAAANPLLRPGVRAVRQAVERWADEEAAGQVGDRALAARALARAGLVRAAAGRNVGPALALPAAEGDVVLRTRALLAPPTPRRPVLAIAVAGLIAVACGAALVTAHGTEDRFEVAQSAFVGAG